jgi:protein-S-isoprenylcysteine O-methyltransferase Ste14
MAPSHFARLRALALAAIKPPPGGKRIILALAFGLAVHSAFAAGIVAMVAAMYFGMSKSLGTVPWPYALAIDSLLVLQFPLLHSLLLTDRGEAFLARLLPGTYGDTLKTTVYALIASVQLFVLFAYWTPSGIVWWRAEGWALYALTVAYGVAWLLLLKASWDAGAEVQSGALGWMSMLAKKKPVFPDMPTTGLFAVIRQPIYVAFALTLWTVPVWTPDQLALAVSWTAYCLAAPKLKERRFAARYGDRFEAYQRSVPYALPAIGKSRNS